MKSHLNIVLLTALLFIVITARTQATRPVVKKTYCNPLVLGQPSTKRLSLSYEIQPSYNSPTSFLSPITQPSSTTRVNATHSIRLGYTKNLVVKPTFYMTFTAGYWFSFFNVENPPVNQFSNLLSQTNFHSFTASTNIFKPLNSKNFLLLNIALEANGNERAFSNFSAKNLLAGGALIYGWKKGMKRMWGLGVSRGYRFGRVAHVPALLYNNSFNKKFGVDALLPLRANFRYTRSPKMMWILGYELDGSQFGVRTSSVASLDNSFLLRGEIRPKIGFDRQLGKAWALTANAGVRLNGRFDMSTDYPGGKIITESNPKPALFVNVGIHIIKFPVKKKKG